MQFELLRPLVPAFRRKDNVLDLACGEGDMIPALTGWIPGRRLSLRKYLGLDADPGKVHRAKVRYPQATFQKSGTPLTPETFDHVFCAGHLYDDAALAEAWRALKFGGTLLVSESSDGVSKNWLVKLIARLVARSELKRHGFEVTKELHGKTLAFLAMKV